MITHSPKETWQHKEQWGWELEVTMKWEEWGWTKFEKEGLEGRQYREVPRISSKNYPSFPLQPFLKNLARMHFHIPQNSFQHHTKYQIPYKWKIWGKKTLRKQENFGNWANFLIISNILHPKDKRETIIKIEKKWTQML